jgi:hypothetical protein
MRGETRYYASPFFSTKRSKVIDGRSKRRSIQRDRWRSVLFLSFSPFSAFFSWKACGGEEEDMMLHTYLLLVLVLVGKAVAQLPSPAPVPSSPPAYPWPSWPTPVPSPPPLPAPAPWPQVCDLTPLIMGCLWDDVTQLNLLVPYGGLSFQIGPTVISFDPRTGCQLVNGSLPPWSPCLARSQQPQQQPSPLSSAANSDNGTFSAWVQNMSVFSWITLVCFFIVIFLAGAAAAVGVAKCRARCRRPGSYNPLLQTVHPQDVYGQSLEMESRH